MNVLRTQANNSRRVPLGAAVVEIIDICGNNGGVVATSYGVQLTEAVGGTVEFDSDSDEGRVKLAAIVLILTGLSDQHLLDGVKVLFRDVRVTQGYSAGSFGTLLVAMRSRNDMAFSAMLAALAVGHVLDFLTWMSITTPKVMEAVQSTDESFPFSDALSLLDVKAATAARFDEATVAA